MIDVSDPSNHELSTMRNLCHTVSKYDELNAVRRLSHFRVDVHDILNTTRFLCRTVSKDDVKLLNAKRTFSHSMCMMSVTS